MMMNLRPRTVPLLALLTAAMATAPAHATNFEQLTGEWSGWGVLRLSGGEHERVKCIAVYRARGGSALSQNLRCASASLRLNALVELTRSGENILGRWEEKVFQTSGTVGGAAHSNGFNLKILGVGFTADLDMTASRCSQSLTFRPSGFNVEKISIGLKRC